MRRKILIGLVVLLGVLLGLIVVAGVVGNFLAPDFSGEARIILNKPPEAIWAALNNHHKLPISGEQCQRVEDLPPENGLAVWREDIGASILTIRVVEAQAPSRMVRTAADSVVPMTIRSEITLTPQDVGTEVRVRTNGRVDSGTWHAPFFRVILRLGAASAGPRNYLNSIAKDLGESAKAE